MPRRPRTHLDNVPLHIVQRGHNREPCFAAEEDYFTYLHWLDVALKENGCALHAYALMTNHVHLLLTPSKAASVPRLIMSLGRRYVQYINTTYRRTGTLWDSRYKSSLIQADTYLLQCMRYIELNPVRAAMVDDPAHYRWTSYRRNALGQASTIVSPHPLYDALGSTAPRRQSAYRGLFRAHLEEAAVADIRLALNQNRFYASIERMLGERRQARPRGRPKAVDTGQTGAASQGQLLF
jgi:putative transposase